MLGYCLAQSKLRTSLNGSPSETNIISGKNNLALGKFTLQALGTLGIPMVSLRDYLRERWMGFYPIEEKWVTEP